MSRAASPPVPDCFVVVREAGERTAAACARLAALEMGEDRVTTIREVPFAAALRRGFELGVEAGRPWTLCLDADVLLAPGAVAAFVAAAEAEWARAPDLFALEALVADKLLGRRRRAGAHLYRTASLREALAHAEFDPRRRRPETDVKRRMRARGHRLPHSRVLVGLHDYEQFRRDLVRKVLTHARKHETSMGYAARYWRRMAAADDDLRVAWLCWRLSEALDELSGPRGGNPEEAVAIDLRLFPSNVDALLVPAGIAERAPLAADAIGPDEVAARLAAFEDCAEYRRERPRMAAAKRASWRRPIAHVRGYGLRGALRDASGRLLAAWGRRLLDEGG